MVQQDPPSNGLAYFMATLSLSFSFVKESKPICGFAGSSPVKRLSSSGSPAGCFTLVEHPKGTRFNGARRGKHSSKVKTSYN